MLVVLAVANLAVIPADAGNLGDWFETSDWRSWTLTQEVGGTEDIAGAHSGHGTFLSGRKLRAGGLSMLLPGAGQLYNGQRTKGLIMIGAEAMVWGAYVGFHKYGGRLSDDYREWSKEFADVRDGDHSDSFYQAVGRYDDHLEWYDSRLREARAFGNPEPSPPSDFSHWQWRSEQYRRDYQLIRADANSAYDHRDMMVLFAVLNRAVSVFDAVRNGDGAHDGGEPGLAAGRAMGAELAFEVSAPLLRPQACASACWSF